MPDTDTSPSISLLWPPGLENLALEDIDRWGAHSIQDLNLNQVAGALSPDARHVNQTQIILRSLNPDPRVILYRQSVLDDCLRCPELLTGIREVLPYISSLVTTRLRFSNPEVTTLFQTVWRLSELELYAESVKKLRKILTTAGSDLHSEGFTHLRDLVTEIETKDTFQCLVNEIPNLRVGINQAASITIGVNLDNEMNPVEATLISINPKRFRGDENSMLNRLMGFRGKDGDQGIAQLHRVPFKTSQFAHDHGIGSFVDPMGERENHLLYPLFKDLDEVLKVIAKPIADALDKYILVNSQFLANLEPEIIFYLGAVSLIQQVQAAGLPMCRVEVAEPNERVCELEDIYNLSLVLRLLDPQQKQDLSQDIVTNDVAFGPQGRIFILTGPNRGGKTIYTQAIGLAQALFQAGLYVPARRARISPVDGIYTHFPVEEKPYFDMGRLGEEAHRLSEVFQKASRYSLVLLNETLSSTSPGECLYLARDVVRALKLLGVRAVYATHLHELAETEAFEDTPSDSPVVSLVAGTAPDQTTPESVRRTYKIVPAPPTGMSFAKDIARKYGISFEQLSQVLQERKVIS